MDKIDRTDCIVHVGFIFHFVNEKKSGASRL